MCLNTLPPDDSDIGFCFLGWGLGDRDVVDDPAARGACVTVGIPFDAGDQLLNVPFDGGLVYGGVGEWEVESEDLGDGRRGVAQCGGRWMWGEGSVVYGPFAILD